ncbi:class I SAM-dependent methyltransferase [Reichenbachiella sp. MSK19-1]|uniref:class I SAM-dependent methyltransferase n=1 Tax=Reichenbachiella sp. MSK19-1 TaxID=1897631 RepID=UPI000E6C093E|nr:class I SAM-dependent methyltransferase [Reichenbachiella sp. MSK19-1]RJE74716.1 hypothetical protein BGP76_16415 [Reichenbachiella sp. MSK19-1]
MSQESTPEELAEIERQLSCPQGENGIKMAAMMNETNAGMITTTIESLEITENNYVLEIGHGNCAHLSTILEQAHGLSYIGVEISETMHEEACRMHAALIESSDIAFERYDGAIIPLADHSVDRILTVNTLYFWGDPVGFLEELYRVLKPNGILSIGYAQKQFMDQLPFVADRFTLYDNHDVKTLVEQTDFEIIDILDHQERVKSKADEWVDRDFSVVRLTKA